MSGREEGTSGGSILGIVISGLVGVAIAMVIEVLVPRDRGLEIVEPRSAVLDESAKPGNDPGGEAGTLPRPTVHQSSSVAPVQAIPKDAGNGPDDPIDGAAHSAATSQQALDDDYLNEIHEAFESLGDDSLFLRQYGTLATRVLGSRKGMSGPAGEAPADTVAEPFFAAYRRISGVNLKSPSPMSIRYSHPRDQLVQTLAYRGGASVWVMAGEELGLGPFDARNMARVLAGGVGQHIQFGSLSPEQQAALVAICGDWDTENRKAKRRLWELLRPALEARKRLGRENSEIAALLVRDGKFHLFRAGEDGPLDGLLNDREATGLAMRTSLRTLLEGQ